MEDKSTRDMLAELLEGQRELHAKVDLLINSQQRALEAPFDIVGADYIAARTGLSERTVRDRKGGVKDIPLARRKPLGWFRSHVDRWLRDQAESASTPKQQALKLLSRKGRVRRSKQ